MKRYLRNDTRNAPRGVRGLVAFVLALFAISACACPAFAGADSNAGNANQQVEAARQLIKRVTPSIADRFVLSYIPPENGMDVYEVESVDGKIVLRGNTGVSLASAYNRYLGEYCRCLFSLWGDQMTLPQSLPAVPTKIHEVNARKLRHFFNYCTFNYSGTWWKWEDWQKIIDFLAMNGINMPLNTVGVEAAWYHALIELGLTDEEARAYLPAPPYLNWQWMGNLEGTGGPLPKSWIDAHEKLGHQIMEREQSLGMTPIAHGFSGVVPRIFKKKFAGAKIATKPDWGRGTFLGTATLDPLDPLFSKVSETYLRQLINRLGTSHYYMIDPFHESSPPVAGDDYLRRVAISIDKSLREVDGQAVWVTQDWTLRPPIIRSIDKSRLIIMSVTGGKCSTYQDWGYQFTVGQLNSFGGETYLHAPLNQEAENRVLQLQKATPNCVGSGMWMESIEAVPANYHLMLELNWKHSAIDLSEWLADYSERRYGGKSEKVNAANALLMESAYTRGSHGFSSIIAARPAMFPIKTGPQKPFEIAKGFDKYVNAWRLLLDERNRFKESKGYRYDAVDWGRQVLSFLAQYYQRDLAVYLYRNDLAGFRKAKARYLNLMEDMDELLGTDDHFLFGKWVQEARNWGTNANEANYYAKFAAIHPTLWGQDNLDYPQPNWSGYAWREWNGLVKTYYEARWRYFLDEVEARLEKGEVYKDGPRDKWGNPLFRGDAVMSKMADWEWAYAEHLPDLTSGPRGDSIDVAVRLFEKYRADLTSVPPQGPEFGSLLAPDDLGRSKTPTLVDAEIKKVIQQGPYIR